MGKLMFTLGFMSFFFSSHAQGYDNIWVFGNELGLDFNGDDPEVMATSTIGIGGTASVCDDSGSLLFYTNGYWVWNKHHELMPELTGGLTGYTAPHYGSPTIGYPPLIDYPGWYPAQNAIITNVPNQEGRYYIFSLGQNALFYSMIDMSLNDGLGGIVEEIKGIPLISGLSEKMAAVKGCNCIWLVTHAKDANIFYAIEINDTGIVTTPVVSEVGGIPGNWNLRGTINFSPDGKQLVQVSSNPFPISYSSGGRAQIRGAVELFSFNGITGKVDNPQLLEYSDSLGNYYGSCFSPDNSKLYISYSSQGPGYIFEPGRIIQYDVSLSSIEEIIASRTIVYEHYMDGYAEDNVGGLKRGPDGKVYFVSGKSYGEAGDGYNPYIHCIQEPNAPGTACAVNPYYLMIPGEITGNKDRGFPADVVLVDSIVWDSTGMSTDVHVCFEDSIRISVSENGRHYGWADGLNGPARIVKETGMYIIQYINEDCKITRDTFRVYFHQVPFYPEQAYSCLNGNKGRLFVAPGVEDSVLYDFTWKDEDGNIIREMAASGSDTTGYLHPGIYYLHLYSSVGCDTTLKMEILALPQPEGHIIMDSIVCNGIPIRFSVETDEENQVLWMYGKGESSTEREVSYSYEDVTGYRIWLALTNPEGCSDTLYKDTYVKDFTIELKARDTLLLSGGNTELWTLAEENYEVLLWEPMAYFPGQNTPGQHLRPDSSLCVYVSTISDWGCIAIDSVWIWVLPDILIPSAFSPNGDGLNDRFAVVGSGGYVIQSFEVFNRYGEQVYASFGPPAERGWDGKDKGRPAEQGVYYYRIMIQTPEREVRMYKGDVTLVR